jgi:hypothetical protein
LDRGDIIQPLDGLFGIGVHTVHTIFETVELSKSLQRDEKTNRALVYPLADTVTGALLNTGYESGIIRNTIEDLARGRVGPSHSTGVGSVPKGKMVTAHHGGAVSCTSDDEGRLGMKNDEKGILSGIRVARGYSGSEKRAVESRSGWCPVRVVLWSRSTIRGGVQGQKQTDMRCCRGSCRAVSVVVMAELSMAEVKGVGACGWVGPSHTHGRT